MLVNNYFIIGILKGKITISNKFKNAKFMFSSFLFIFPVFDGNLMVYRYKCVYEDILEHMLKLTSVQNLFNSLPRC